MKDSKPSLAELRALRTAQAQQPTAPAPARRRKAHVPHPAAGRPADASKPAAPGRPTGAPPALPNAPDAPASAALDAGDRALFRQAMRFVQPLPDHGPRARAIRPGAPSSQLQQRRAHAQGASVDAPPRPRLAQTPPHQPLPPLDADAREFLQPNCGPDLLHGLRRGKWSVQASLDLHGSNLEQSRERLDRFLGSCLNHGIRCVRIIHGKGIGSQSGESVLKTAIRGDLSRLEAVQAWVQCAERDGGAGAVTALLRLPPGAFSPGD